MVSCPLLSFPSLYNGGERTLGIRSPDAAFGPGLGARAGSRAWNEWVRVAPTRAAGNATRAEGAGLPLSRTRPSWNSLVPRRPQTLQRPLSPLFCYPNLLRILRWLQVPPPATCAAAPLRADSPVWPRPLHALQKTCLLGYLLYGGSEGTEDLHRLRTALQCISIEGGSEGHGTSFCESQTGRLRRRNGLHGGLPSPHPWQLHPG